MMSKLISLLMDYEKKNQLPRLEQFPGLSRTLQTSTMDVFENIISNVNLKLLFVLGKKSNLDD